MHIRTIAYAILPLLAAAPALAQSETFLAHRAFETCVREKAVAFAKLEGAISDIAAAAVAACQPDREVMRQAYHEHYSSLGASSDVAASSARAMVRELEGDAVSAAMVTIAETRLARN